MPAPAHVVLVFHVDTAFGRGVLSGIARFVREHAEPSVQLELVPMRHGPRRVRGFRGRGLIANVCLEALAEAIRDAGVAAVNVAESLPGVELPQVISDNAAVGRLAAEHLLDRGLRNFAYFGLEGYGFSRVRGEAFSRAVGAAGYDCRFYPPDAELRRRWIWHHRRGAFERWLASLPKPVGLMACMDYAARHLVDACLRAHLRVPDDVAVVGVDNDEVQCQMAGVPISSVSPATRRIGYEAMGLLTRLMAGAAPPPQPVRIPPTGIVVRRSSDIFAVEDAEVAQALRFIHQHVGESLKVPDLLATVPLSRRELERRFARQLGRSPHAEIRRAQIERAKRLLAETDLPMSQVAAAAGLKESKRLSAVFRQEMDISPTEYRRRFRVG
jgi:LacI family transcriptional regulator